MGSQGRWAGGLRDSPWLPLVALALLVIANALTIDGFLAISWRDERLSGIPIDILRHGARLGIAALGMALVIGLGGVDLSVGSSAAIGGAISAWLVAHAPWPVACAGAIAGTLSVGLCNGAIIGALGLQPIVATLVLMVAGRGIAQLLTGGSILTFEDPGLAAFGNGSLLGTPSTFWLMLAVLAITAAITRLTTAGPWLRAIGDSRESAARCGVDTRRTTLAAYAACAAAAGLVGVIDASYIKAADPGNAGQMLELDAIIAAVIGGNSLRGGRLNLLGACLGAMLIQTITTTMYLRDVPSEIAPAPKAALVLLICVLARLGGRRA